MSYRVIIQPNAEAEPNPAYAYRHARAPQAAARWFAGCGEAINALFVGKNACVQGGD